MGLDDALRGRWRRLREVGVGGVARRVADRAAGPARARRRAAWRASHEGRAWDEPGLAAALGVAPAAVIGAARAAWDGSGRGFWIDAADDALRAAFLERHAEAARGIAAQAEAALAGDLSWVVPGGIADWHAALPGAGRWPLVPGEDVPIGAATPLGDVRLAWEVGRCPHLVRIAQAAWLARDGSLARSAVALLEDWIAANPPGLGIAWAHAQEVALRAVAWLFAIELLRPLGAIDDALLARLTWLLHVHATYADAYATDDPITHNHLVSEGFGLAAVGIALPGLAGAARWRARGLRLLWRETVKQVDDEGVHGEGSTHYHAFVLDSLVAAVLLADRAGVGVPARARERVAAMADALASWLFADGTVAALGDTDAGRAWRLGLDPLDRRDVVAAAAVAFARADLGAVAGDAAGAFWLTGGRLVPGAGATPARAGVRRFAQGGIAVARGGRGDAAEVLLFRAGRTAFLPDVLLSHLHADALSLVWRVGAQDVLVDPGTHLYSEGEGWRVALRRTSAHSCVVVDGNDQADVTSQRFGLTGQRPARWLACEGDEGRLHACAEHPAGGAPRVRRRVAWRAGFCLALCDDVLGDGAHRVQSWLQLPAAAGEATTDGARLRLADGHSLRVQVFGAVESLALLRPADGDAPGPGWRAPRYGRRAPGTALRIDAGLRPLPVRIVTLLLLAPPGAEPARGALVEAGAATAVEAGSVRIRFDGESGVASEDLR